MKSSIRLLWKHIYISYCIKFTIAAVLFKEDLLTTHIKKLFQKYSEIFFYSIRKKFFYLENLISKSLERNFFLVIFVLPAIQIADTLNQWIMFIYWMKILWFYDHSKLFPFYAREYLVFNLLRFYAPNTWVLPSSGFMPRIPGI